MLSPRLLVSKFNSSMLLRGIYKINLYVVIIKYLDFPLSALIRWSHPIFPILFFARFITFAFLLIEDNSWLAPIGVILLLAR